MRLGRMRGRKSVCPAIVLPRRVSVIMEITKKYLSSLVVAGVLMAPWAAAEEAGPKQGRVYMGGGGVMYQSPFNAAENKREIGPGLIVGIGLTDRLSAEVLLSHVDQDYEVGALSGDGDAEMVWANLLYQIGPEGPWRPFFTAGVGRTETDFGDLGTEDDTQFNIGLGVFRALNERWSLRADVRGVSTDDGDTDFEPFAFLGVSGVLGDITKAPPPDTDGDGVPDVDDQCPNTPFGRDVGPDGCQLDSDGDGVVDGDDRCPGTPKGVAVDSRGCPLDSDGDGVPDHKDECPDSEAGARVDEKGCYVELEETVTIDLNLEFDTNSAELRPDHVPQIQRVVDFLREYPTANAVIEGHTDSDGSEAYNQALSERRAESVRAYLVERGDVRADRLTARGYGESRPKTSNDTREGKQANRRVSAVVSGTHTVRQQ